MRKITLLLVLVLIGFGSFVMASNIEGTFEFEEGWNLVPGFANPSQLIGGDIAPDNIKAVYLLKQPEQEYVRVYPNPDFDELDGLDDDYYEKTSQWVFSDKAGRSEYILEEPLPIEEFQIYEGWNFIILSKYLIEGAGTGLEDPTLDDVSGSCNIEKAFLFGDGRWVDFRSIYPEMDSTLLMSSLVIKVSDDCRLGVNDGGIGGPPAIP